MHGVYHTPAHQRRVNDVLTRKARIASRALIFTRNYPTVGARGIHIHRTTRDSTSHASCVVCHYNMIVRKTRERNIQRALLLTVRAATSRLARDVPAMRVVYARPARHNLIVVRREQSND